MIMKKMLLLNQCCIILDERMGKDTDQLYKNESQKDDLELPLLNLSEIAKATHNFSFDNKLGEGGYGPVYKVSYLFNQLHNFSF